MLKKIYSLKYIILIVLTLIILGIFGFAPRKINVPRQLPIQREAPEVRFKDFHLLIPKLNISTPIIADVDGNDKDAYFTALENGVAQMKGSYKPGEGSNVFIFGHSSFYWWSPGDYKDVFAKLEDIQVGDEVKLWWNSKEYRYKVTQTKVVDPNDISVVQATQSEQVTIMTCVPVGTNKQRLIVIAKPY